MATLKVYKKGEMVNVVRGKMKGISGMVDEMNAVTGDVTITNGDGIYVTVSQGCLARPAKIQDLMPLMEGDASEPEQEEGTEVVQIDGLRIEGPEVVKVVRPAESKKESRECVCGCGEMTSKGKFFMPGHDQRHKGNLIRAMQAGSEEAEAELRNRKWRSEAEIMELKRKARAKAEKAAAKTE